jgi:hypothetical protein
MRKKLEIDLVGCKAWIRSMEGSQGAHLEAISRITLLEGELAAGRHEAAEAAENLQAAAAEYQVGAQLPGAGAGSSRGEQGEAGRAASQPEHH